MQSVCAAVLVRRNVIVHTINVERAILDTVCVASRDTSKVGMNWVYRVVRGIIKAKYNVALNTILTLDEKVGDGGTVGNEQSTDAFGRDLILAVLIRTGGGVSRVVGRCRKGSRRE